jgi:phosphoglycerol transferase MdoB-like AlkP superfamily enzyme
MSILKFDREQFINARQLTYRLGIIFLCYTLSRPLFYFINYTLFPELPLSVFLHGIRYDLAAISLIYLPFILMSVVYPPAHRNKVYRRILKIVFHTINGAALLLNCSDFAFFQFSAKRMTRDIFNMITIGEDFTTLLPQYAIDYWYVLASWAGLMFLSEYLYRKTDRVDWSSVRLKLIPQAVIFILITGILVITGRGGLQLKPISILTAGQHVSSLYIPVVLNTPFTLAKTIYKKGIKPRKYFDQSELETIFSPEIRFRAEKPARKLNVVLIMMESFASEYVSGLNNGKGYTPFLDSLMKKSLVFDNAYANGKLTMMALPSILTALPHLMTEPYITSAYSSNELRGIAEILKDEGYSTSFFHGGRNGTMRFDIFINIAGFENYFGKDEYGNDGHYDGMWGIWDEEYFQYFASHLDNTPQPFFSSILTLTSHSPHRIPARYEGRFPEGELRIHKCVGYADYSLGRFFETVSKMKWFDSTLFIITADHTSIADRARYKHMVGKFAVPIIFYHPGANLTGVRHEVVQHTDIIPSILDYLDYSGDFISFGSSVFDTVNSRYAVNYLSGVYQIIEDSLALQFDGEKVTGLYNYYSDTLMENNIIGTFPDQEMQMERLLKAVIQSFDSRMINNKLVIRE